MKVYMRGEEAWGLDNKNAVWVAYYYRSGDYDGSGSCLVKYSNGFYYYGSLSHCSCYGPWEDVPSEGSETFEQAMSHIKIDGVDEETKLLLEAIRQAIVEEQDERVCDTCAHDPNNDKDVRRWCGTCELYAYREKEYHWLKKKSKLDLVQ